MHSRSNLNRSRIVPQIKIVDKTGKEMGLIDDERGVTQINEAWRGKADQEADKALEEEKEDE